MVRLTDCLTCFQTFDVPNQLEITNEKLRFNARVSLFITESKRTETLKAHQPKLMCDNAIRPETHSQSC